MDDIYQICKEYGSNSKLCHKTAVGDTANFSLGEAAGEVAGKIVTRWAGCNAMLDIETAGTGILVCTVAIGLASIGASTVIGNAAKDGVNIGYNISDYFSQSHQKSSNTVNTRPSTIIYQQSFNLTQ